MSEIHVVLISCTKAKFKKPMAAKDLYAASAWFRSAWAYAVVRASVAASDIYILSAMHGLVKPDQVLEPYDYKMPARIVPRMDWALGIRDDLHYIYEGQRVCFWLLAGRYYRDPLALWLVVKGAGYWRVMEPMARIKGIQAQRDWLSTAKRRLMDEQARSFGDEISV